METDTNLLFYRSKSGCRKCKGKGYYVRQTGPINRLLNVTYPIEKGSPILETIVQCNCTKVKMVAANATD